MACLEYTPTEWFNNTAPAINASNLNHIEVGIKSITDCHNTFEQSIDARLIQLEQRINDLELAPPAHTHPISEVIDLQTELDRCPKGSWSRTDDTLTIDIEGS